MSRQGGAWRHAGGADMARCGRLQHVHLAGRQRWPVRLEHRSRRCYQGRSKGGASEPAGRRRGERGEGHPVPDRVAQARREGRACSASAPRKGTPRSQVVGGVERPASAGAKDSQPWGCHADDRLAKVGGGAIAGCQQCVKKVARGHAAERAGCDAGLSRSGWRFHSSVHITRAGSNWPAGTART